MTYPPENGTSYPAPGTTPSVASPSMASRERLAYVAVALGALLATALIRWYPIVPPPRAALRIVSDASPVIVPPVPAPSSSATPAISRKTDPAPVIERRRAVIDSPNAPEQEAPSPVEDLSPPPSAPRPRKTTPSGRLASMPRVEMRKDTPFMLPPKPETFAEKPRLEIEIPPTILPAAAQRPAGTRARIGDVEKFKARLRELAIVHEAGLSLQSAGFRFTIPAARQTELKKDVDAAIRDFLAEDGAEIYVEIKAN